jgi:indolepyruvate ferredoxin oxidoreductase
MARIDAQLAILTAQGAVDADPAHARRGRRRAPALVLLGLPAQHQHRVPEGSRAMAGIGCHFMAIWMDRATVGFTQMGGEGVPWVGQQPFTATTSTSSPTWATAPISTAACSRCARASRPV